MAELVIVGGGRDREAYANNACYALIVDGVTYMLDCGEGSLARMNRLGLDLLQVRAVFLSHMHYDHLAGLFGFLYNFWGACRRDEDVPEGIRAWSSYRALPESAIPKELTLCVPAESIDFWERALPATYIPREIWYTDLKLQPIGVGPFYADERLRAAAYANGHLRSQDVLLDLPARYPGLALQSNSFMLELAGCRLVYSGDLALAGSAGIEEFRPLAEQADVLMTEVAHLPPEEYLDMLAGTRVRQVLMIHVHANLQARVDAWLAAHRDPRFLRPENGTRINLTP